MTEDNRASHDELRDLLLFAEDIAARVGRRVRESALDRADATTKSSAADWVTPVDGEAEDAIRAAILDRYPDHAIIGEERAPTGDADTARIVWHVDPIDGTTNFLYGLGNVSVSVAAIDPAGIAVGVVHDVYRDQTISAARGLGVRLNGEPVRHGPEADSVSGQVVLTEWDGGYHVWSGMGEFVRWVSERKGTIRIIGSCALALAHAGLGRVAATVLPGRYNSWDVAAGIVIATEGGYQLFDADGPTDQLPPDGLIVAGPGVAGAVWSAWRESVREHQLATTAAP